MPRAVRRPVRPVLPAIYRYVASRLGPDIADDLAAETFLAAFRARSRFDAAQGSARSWLYGIATNMIGRHRRAEARRYRALARTPHGGPEYGEEDRIAEQVSARQLRGPLMQALARAGRGRSRRAAADLLGGLSYDEVATALAIAPGTVGSRLNRARRKVRARSRSATRPTKHRRCQLHDKDSNMHNTDDLELVRACWPASTGPHRSAPGPGPGCPPGAGRRDGGPAGQQPPAAVRAARPGPGAGVAGGGPPRRRPRRPCWSRLRAPGRRARPCGAAAATSPAPGAGAAPRSTSC